jgi:hypothetical protein
MSDAVVLAWQTVLEAAIRWLPVFGLAALTARLLKRRPARERHAVWLVALTCLGALSLGGGRLPVGAVLVPSELKPIFRPQPEIIPAVARAESQVSSPVGVRVVNGGGSADSDGFAGRNAPTTNSAWPWSLRLAVFWAAVALALFARELLAVVSAWILGRRASEIGEKKLLPDLALDDGDPKILDGDTEVPILIGFHRPRILLPGDWPLWPEVWLRAAILHERAHARRRDLMALTAGRVIRAVFWFHPGVWYGVRELKREAERATDEQVLRSGMDRFEYADALLGLARQLGRRRIAPAGLPMASSGGLQARLLQVVESDSRRLSRSRGAVLAAVIPVAAAAILAASPAIQAPPAQWLERVELADGGVLWRAACPLDETGCSEIVNEAVRLLREIDSGGIVAIQDVVSAHVIAYAFVDRSGLLPAVPAVPISAVAGIPLAAAWWEAGMADRPLPCPAVINLAGAGPFANTNGLDTGMIRAPMDVVTMQCATAAIAMGWYLDNDRGATYLERAFARWGFAPAPGEAFWSGASAPEPAAPRVPGHAAAASATWLVAGSAHGTVQTTPLHLTRFLQTVGNRGRMIRPSPPGSHGSVASMAIMEVSTADRLLQTLAQLAGGDTEGGSLPRLIGIVGHTPVTSGGDGAELFAGLLLNDRAEPRYSIAVWLPSQAGDPQSGMSTARSLAAQILDAH